MQHSLMASTSSSCRAPSSTAWLAGLARPAPAPTTDQLREGRELFVDLGCASCHAVRGVSDARLGPDLTQVGARRTIGAGALPGGVGNIAGWIASAQHLKPGNAMPSYDQLEGPQLRRPGRVPGVAQMTADPQRGARAPASRSGCRACPVPAIVGPDGHERLQKAWAKPARFAFFTEVNNTHIGVLYIATGFLFFVGAGVLALLMRIQLAIPGNDVPGRRHLQPGLHDARHRDDVPVRRADRRGGRRAAAAEHARRARHAVPAAVGARLLVPTPSAALLVFASLFFGIAPDGGWFMYPPLTGPRYSPGLNTDVWMLGLGFVEISAIAAAVELIVGILRTRAPGMTLGTHADLRLVHAGHRRHDHDRHAGGDRRRHPARAGARLRLAVLRCRPAAATRCSGSTCSGCSATPRSTSSSCRPPAWCR